MAFFWIFVCHNKIWNLHLRALELENRLTIYEATPDVTTETARV
jgi:hypothetical protein